MTEKKFTHESRPWIGWYKRASWIRLRKKQLKREPFCRMCKPDLLTSADTVDHIHPHRGDMQKFFDPGNLQSLCKPCHSSTKQRIEKSGEFGCDSDGMIPAWREKNAAP